MFLDSQNSELCQHNRLLHVPRVFLLWASTYLIQLSLRLFFHPSNIIHSQVNPLIEPTEQLPVEVCKQTLLLLEK